MSAIPSAQAAAPEADGRGAGSRRRPGARLLLGWATVVLAIAISSLWAFWASIENFHEGWYYPTLLQNIGLMLVQYLGFPLAFLALALTGVRWPRLGGTLHFAVALAAALFFRGGAGAWLIALPLALIGLGFWFGRPRPRRWAYALVAGLPLLVMLGFGIPTAIRVAGRFNDGDLGARLVEGNGVTLIWAPRGPGWPAGGGATWLQARDACARLDVTGTALTDDSPGWWRLPTVDEAVRSMVRHGRNAGGQWDAGTARAVYAVKPDKESPLWDIYSKVIYWWSSTEVDDQRAYRITYTGEVVAWPKDQHPSYLMFRCVREPRTPSNTSSPGR